MHHNLVAVYYLLSLTADSRVIPLIETLFALSVIAYSQVRKVRLSIIAWLRLIFSGRVCTTALLVIRSAHQHRPDDHQSSDKGIHSE